MFINGICYNFSNKNEILHLIKNDSSFIFSEEISCLSEFEDNSNLIDIYGSNQINEFNENEESSLQSISSEKKIIRLIFFWK